MSWLNQTVLNLGLPFTPLELVGGGIACALALWLGRSLAKVQAHAFAPPQDDTSSSCALPDGNFPTVTFLDYGDMRFLHLGTPAVQGSMKISKPFDIHLEYVQRMMGWLLFTDLDTVKDLHVMQLGLGAAALTKFCHQALGMQTTAIELNPQVIATCRQWFNLPLDDLKLQVTLGDAADVVTQTQWLGKVDALQVDLYDQDAESPVHDSAAFYANCRRLLTPDGCLVVNLFGQGMNFQHSMQKIAHSFGEDALWTFKPTPAGNTIALAFHTPRREEKSALLMQANRIEARWPLPARKWLKVLSPYTHHHLAR